MMPDGKSFITAAGTQQSAIWVHDPEGGNKQVTSEGYCYLPTLSPDGSKVYFLKRAPGSHSYFSGGLWVSNLTSGNSQRLFFLTCCSLISQYPKTGGKWHLQRNRGRRDLEFGSPCSTKHNLHGN